MASQHLPASVSVCGPLKRAPFTYLHTSLFEQQKLVAFDRAHNGELGAKGWVFPWLLFAPPAAAVIDLGKPCFISKVSMRNTNVLASPRKLGLAFSDHKDGPWTEAYSLEHAQCNRLALAAPPNNDVEGIESEANETFYLLGDRTNDEVPVWSVRTQQPVQEQSMAMAANRGRITAVGPRFCVARYWRLTIKDSNGLHYVGTQYVALFGQSDPLPAPAGVTVSVLSHEDRDVFRVSWTRSVEHRTASAFRVVAFAHDIGLGSGGFVVECANDAASCLVTDLSLACPYVFIVYALRGDRCGVPSEPTKPIAINPEGWMRLPSVTLESAVENFTIAGDETAENHQAPTHPVPPAATLPGRVGSGVGAVGNQNVTVGLNAESVRLQEMVRKERAARRKALSAAQYRQEFDAQLQSMLGGDFEACDEVNPASQVTAFISSTFADTTAERNFFMEFAYPELNRFCQSLGLTFNTVDLRWGVRNESTDDHMTIDICLGELKRCMASSTAASFVFLSGERYGWRALPNRVPAAELDSILSLMPAGEAKETIRHWYLRDDNETSPVYILQSISSMKGKQGLRFDDFWGSSHVRSAQTLMQEGIRSTLLAAGDSISALVRRNWMISVTEREVLAGLFEWGNEDVELQAMVLMRSIHGLEAAAQQKDEKARVYYTAEDEDRGLLNELRERVKAETPDSSMREYQVPWNVDGISTATHGDYIREVAAAFVHDMEERIRMGLSKRRLLQDEEKEAFQQSSFALNRCRTFFGRADVISSLSHLAAVERGGGVRCVHGTSGAGKTSAMSVLAVSGKKQHYHTVVFRACGTSVSSSSAMGLMSSICRQLELRFGIKRSSPTVDFDDQVSYFHQCLNLATQAKPLLVVLDSLDQLSNSDQDRTQPWRWLPAPDSIANTTLVVSTLPEPKYGVLPALKQRLVANDMLEICPLSAVDEALAILDEWLAERNRRLQPDQRHKVQQSLSKAQSITMLHLKLVFDQVLRWKSYTPATELAATVPSLIEDIFKRLEHFHGERLVCEVLALLNASRSGLSEKNLLDLVSGNDSVLGSYGEEGAVLQYHQPPQRRLPPLVFSRLRRDLQDYMVERGANGVAVLNMYHRQFIEVSMQRYPPGDKAKALASFFSGDLANHFPDRLIEPNPLYFSREGPGGATKTPNLQMLHELPHALAGSNQMELLGEFLCSMDVVEAAFQAGVTFASDMLTFYRMPCDALVHDRAALHAQGILLQPVLQWYFRFVSRWFHTLCLDPALLPGLAANSPQQNPVAVAMLERMQRGEESRPWLKWAHPPQQLDPIVLKKVLPAPVVACRWARGIDGALLAACTGCTCVLVDTRSNQVLTTFSRHKDLVLDCDFSPTAGKVLSVGRAAEAFIWDAATGVLGLTLPMPRGWVTSCKWGTSVIMAGTASGLVLLWHPESGNQLGVLEGHTGPLSSCALSPDASSMTAVTCSLDASAIVWNLREQEPIVRLDCDNAAANCVAWAPNGRVIAVAHDKKACVLWAKQREGGASVWAISKSLDAHASEVWSCCFSPDSSQVVTVGADRTGRVFSVRSGELLCTLAGHAQWVWGCDWVGREIATCSMDCSVIVWDRAHVVDGSETEEATPLVGLQVSASEELHTLSKELVWKRLDKQTLDVLSVTPAPPDAPVGQAGQASLSPAADRWVYSLYDTSFAVQSASAVRTVRIQGFGKFCHMRAIWNPRNPSQVLSGTHGGSVLLLSDADTGRVLHGAHRTPGWVEDLFWSPDGQIAVAAGQQGTAILDMHRQQSFMLPIPMFAAALDSSKQRVAGLTLAGKGYERHATGGVITQLHHNSEPLALEDPFGELAFSRERLCRWICSDSLVAMTSSPASPFGCPQVVIFDATLGSVVCRFCSPFSEEFQRMEVVATAGGHDCQLVLADANGRIFVLELLNHHM